MAELTEGRHAGEFVVTESPQSREKVTVLSGQNLKVGTIVGKVDRAAGKAAIPAVVGTGNGVMSALFAGPDVEKGNYVVTCITAAANGGIFSVLTPSGKLLQNAVVGTAYRSRRINFLIADGATDFIVGDVFTITVGTGDPAVVGTGNGTLTGISLGRAARTGRYRVECIEAILNGGAFKVVDPDGEVCDAGYIVAGAGGTLVLANKEQINLTITDGSTDFAVGDFYEVFVYNELTKKVVAWNPAPSTFDGRQVVAGVLYDAVDATSADLPGVMIARDAEVNAEELEYLSTLTAGEKEMAKALLASTLGIVAR